MPLMIIFPRKCLTPQLMQDAPEGSVGKCSDNGWIDSGSFLDWLKHFVSFTGVSPDNKAS